MTVMSSRTLKSVKMVYPIVLKVATTVRVIVTSSTTVNVSNAASGLPTVVYRYCYTLLFTGG